MGAVETKDRVDLVLEQWGERLPPEDRALTAVTKRVAVVQRRLVEETASALAELGLGTGEFDVLAVLLREAPRAGMRPHALQESMMWSSGGISNVLRRLERGGLVTRRRDTADARASLVSLTRSGRTLGEQALAAVSARHRQVLGAVPRGELARVADALRPLTLAVDSAGQATRKTGLGSPR